MRSSPRLLSSSGPQSETEINLAVPNGPAQKQEILDLFTRRQLGNVNSTSDSSTSLLLECEQAGCEKHNEKASDDINNAQQRVHGPNAPPIITPDTSITIDEIKSPNSHQNINNNRNTPATTSFSSGFRGKPVVSTIKEIPAESKRRIPRKKYLSAKAKESPLFSNSLDQHSQSAPVSSKHFRSLSPFDGDKITELVSDSTHTRTAPILPVHLRSRSSPTMAQPSTLLEPAFLNEKRNNSQVNDAKDFARDNTNNINATKEKLKKKFPSDHTKGVTDTDFQKQSNLLQDTRTIKKTKRKREDEPGSPATIQQILNHKLKEKLATKKAKNFQPTSSVKEKSERPVNAISVKPTKSSTPKVQQVRKRSKTPTVSAIPLSVRPSSAVAIKKHAIPRAGSAEKNKQTIEQQYNKIQAEIEEFKNKTLGSRKPGLFPLSLTSPIIKSHPKFLNPQLSMLRGADSAKKLKLQEKMIGNVKAKVLSMYEVPEDSIFALPAPATVVSTSVAFEEEAPSPPYSVGSPIMTVGPLSLSTFSTSPSKTFQLAEDQPLAVDPELLGQEVLYMAEEYFTSPELFWWNAELKPFKKPAVPTYHNHNYCEKELKSSSTKDSPKLGAYEYDSLACFLKQVHVGYCTTSSDLRDLHYFRIHTHGTPRELKLYGFIPTFERATKFYNDLFLATVGQKDWPNILQQIKLQKITPYEFVEKRKALDMFDNLEILKTVGWNQFRDIFPATFVSHWLGPLCYAGEDKNAGDSIYKNSALLARKRKLAQTQPFEYKLQMVDESMILMLCF